MNFLGHLYFSGDDPLVITGNFMADPVKGRDLSAHASGIQQGIRLHRRIDSFTDTHELTSLGRARLRAHAGRYAGVVLDLFYDHLLAAQWRDRHPEPLKDYTARMYALLQAHLDEMPEATRRMLPYMVSGDWLSSYAEIGGLARALAGLSRRVRQGGAMLGAERVLVEHYGAFNIEFDRFMTDLRMHLSA